MIGCPVRWFSKLPAENTMKNSRDSADKNINGNQQRLLSAAEPIQLKQTDSGSKNKTGPHIPPIVKQHGDLAYQSDRKQYSAGNEHADAAPAKDAKV